MTNRPLVVVVLGSALVVAATILAWIQLRDEDWRPVPLADAPARIVPPAVETAATAAPPTVAPASPAPAAPPAIRPAPETNQAVATQVPTTQSPVIAPAPTPPPAAVAPAPIPPPQRAEAQPVPDPIPPPTSRPPATTQAALPEPPVVAPAPARPAAASPAPVPQTVPPAPSNPSFDVVRVSPLGDAVIAGRAEPDSVVTVYDSETEIARAKADARGEWVVIPDKRLAPGNRELSLKAELPDRPAQRSDNVVVLAVPQPGRDLAGEAAARPTPPLALLAPREGAGRSTVLQVPSVEPAPAPSTNPEGQALNLDTVDYDAAGNVVFGGRSPPGESVQVYVDNQPVGRAESSVAGDWTVTPQEPVDPGVHTLRVDQISPGGRVVARLEVPFVRADLSLQLPNEGRVIVQPGNSLWRIARRSYGQGVRFTVIYQANRDQIRDPSMIYPGQVFIVPQVN